MSDRISARMRDINVEWLNRAAEVDHLFHTRWLGERFFHLPGDMLAIQELVWRTQPDCILQTGIAAGGGVVFSASMLALTSDTAQVTAVDPGLRDEVHTRLLAHRLGPRMRLIHGESCAPDTMTQMREATQGASSVMVILDLTHTQAHVERELDCYAELVTPGNYLVVMDTIMEYLPADTFAGKPYGRGNNPATAVQAFLRRDDRFEVDEDIEDRVIMTLSPGGFLKRVR